MIRQAHALEREVIVADAIREVVSELRLVDVADYVAFVRMEHMASLGDIVDSAAELYLMPGTLRLGHGATADVEWDSTPRVCLDLELRPAGATVFFSLHLEAERAGVEVNYVGFDQPDEDPAANTAFLETALQKARIRKTLEAAG
jgi:hypothetical protein